MAKTSSFVKHAFIGTTVRPLGVDEGARLAWTIIAAMAAAVTAASTLCLVAGLTDLSGTSTLVEGVGGLVGREDAAGARAWAIRPLKAPQASPTGTARSRQVHWSQARSGGLPSRPQMPLAPRERVSPPHRSIQPQAGRPRKLYRIHDTRSTPLRLTGIIPTRCEPLHNYSSPRMTSSVAVVGSNPALAAAMGVI
jgi:hypothetical protein